MRTGRRRKVDVVLMVLTAALVGVIACAAGLFGDAERVSGIWASATVKADGSARIVDVIDYDFGLGIDKHGIFRDVPDLSIVPDVNKVVVASPTAPDDFVIIPGGGAGGETRIRIGDANQTVSGRHRYAISYELPAEAMTPTRGGETAWNAIGTQWPVLISNGEVHLVGRWQWNDITCVVGSFGSGTPCDYVEQVEPGHIVARGGPFDSGEGMTIGATPGRPIEAMPRVEPPKGPAVDPGAPLLEIFAFAAAASLAAALVVSFFVRRAGRERITIGAGGAADAAFATTGGDERRVDATELASYATTEFAPPKELHPAEGGVLLTETVTNDHRVAWLIEAAIDGYVHIQEANGKAVAIQRLDKVDASETSKALEPAFGGRPVIALGSYDPGFAATWGRVGKDLEKWQKTTGYWDEKKAKRVTWSRVIGVLLEIVGIAVVGLGGVLARRWGSEWLWVAAVGGAVSGLAWALIIRAWELRVRTPLGSAMWLRVESFRRFLHDSEAYHAEEAAKRGVFREYTAWAVAVGEIGRWSKAMEASSIAPEVRVASYAYIAPSLSHSTASTSTAPSSSGGGGGGGGSVGGGGGGGGGGSW